MSTIRWAATVKGIRRRYHLTQVELARELGVHAVTIGRWETGVHPPHRFLEQRLLDMAARSHR